MVRTCGIHVDRDHVRVVALDGSAKKHKVVFSDEEPIDGGTVGEALKELTRRNKLKAEDIGLAVDSGIAAFRRMSLPFDDRSKIEEVLKYEIENDLPQWDIDDVIVDFLVADSRPGVSSELVVCAVPKELLERHIEALSKGGLEPTEAELDASAMFDAVLASGELTPDTAKVIVHVGDGSTIVAVADGEQLSTLRALRTGALPKRAAAPAPAEDEELEGEEEAEVEAPVEVGPTEAELRERARQTVTRIRREILRTIAGARTENELDAVLLTGQYLEGLDAEDYEGREAVWIDAVDGEVPSGAMVAYGAALHQMGGGMLKPQLRREELRFTGTLERLELPLAVFAMLLFAFLFTQWVIVEKQLAWKDEGKLAKGQPGDMQLWLDATTAYLLPREGTWPGYLEKPSDELVAYAKKAMEGGDDTRTKYGEIQQLKKMLQMEILNLQRELGQVSEITLPLSAFKSGVLIMDVMDRMKASESVPRFAVRQMTSDYVQRAAQRGGDYVQVKLDLDFWGDDGLMATKHFNDFKAEVERQPWVVNVEATNVRSVEGQPITFVDGMKIEIDPTKAETGAN